MIGKSVPEPRRFFFAGARLRAPAGQIFADVEPATMRRKSCRFFWFWHEALRPLLRATKRLVASASPPGRYFAAGCGHEGNTDHQKLDGTQPTGFVGVFFFGGLFRQNKAIATSSEHRAGGAGQSRRRRADVLFDTTPTGKHLHIGCPWRHRASAGRQHATERRVPQPT